VVVVRDNVNDVAVGDNVDLDGADARHVLPLEDVCPQFGGLEFGVSDIGSGQHVALSLPPTGATGGSLVPHLSLPGWGAILTHWRRMDAHIGRAHSLEDMMKRMDRVRMTRILAAAVIVVGSLGACTARQSDGGSTAASDRAPSPTSVSTTSTTPNSLPSDEAQCTKSSIEGALPEGSVLDTYGCTIASPNQWAAARLKTGAVFFLTSAAGPWIVTPGATLCGARRNEVPAELRSYCG
jgi:hypothetical protein